MLDESHYGCRRRPPGIPKSHKFSPDRIRPAPSLSYSLLARYCTLMASAITPRLRYLLILDFEATCGDTIPKHEQEIIEFPTLLYNILEQKVEQTFHEYVRPVRQPVLTEFCTTLTGISQVSLSAFLST
jgi:hypothetical protein